MFCRNFVDKLSRIKVVFVFPAILLLGLALRLYGLTLKPLWYDEIVFFAHAVKGWDFMFHPVSIYKMPYIILLKSWTAVFGMDIFSARLLSVMLSVTSVILTYYLGRMLFNRKSALIASLFLAISCFDIYHAQQLKHYELLNVLVLSSCICFFAYLEKKKPAALSANVLFNILSVCTHPFGISIVFVQFIYVFCMRREIENRQLRQWRRFQLPLLFFLGIWAMVLCAGKQNFEGILWWSRPPLLRNLIETYTTFVYGGPAYGLSSLEYTVFPVTITVSLMLVFGGLFLRGIFAIAGKGADRRQAFVVIWLVLPLLMSFIFSYLFFPVYFIKNFLFFLPAFYLIVARGACFKRKLASGSLITAILLLNILPLRVMYNAKINVDWKEAVRFIKNNGLSPNDIFVVATTKEVAPFMYYLYDGEQEGIRDVFIFGKFEKNAWQDLFIHKDHIVVALASEKDIDKCAARDPGPGLNKIYRSGYLVSEFDKKFLRNQEIVKSRKPVWVLISKWAGDAHGKRVFIDKLSKDYKLACSGEPGGVAVYRFVPKEE